PPWLIPISAATNGGWAGPMSRSAIFICVPLQVVHGVRTPPRKSSRRCGLAPFEDAGTPVEVVETVDVARSCLVHDVHADRIRRERSPATQPRRRKDVDSSVRPIHGRKALSVGERVLRRS